MKKKSMLKSKDEGSYDSPAVSYRGPHVDIGCGGVGCGGLAAGEMMCVCGGGVFRIRLN